MEKTGGVEMEKKDASSFAPIWDILLGPVRMAILEAAIELGIADVLESDRETAQIAKRLNADPGNTVRFLDALTAMDFISKQDGHYCNTPFASAYLRTSSPTYFGGFVRNMKDMQHRNLGRIPELVRSGPPGPGKMKRIDDEGQWKRSVRHLATYQKAGVADRIADLVAELPEYPGMRRMLDVGCGPGIICMRIVERHPHMMGVLCDLPPVIAAAREEIAAAGLESRMSVISGDYNETDLGEGYDLVWAGHNLYFAKDLRRFLRRVFKAMNPRGVFVSYHEGLTHERTQPTSVVLSRLSLALEGQDVSFERGEIAGILPDAGFHSVQSDILPMPTGEIELVVARKAGA
jgi:SAM-dependent methyltransferase